MRTRTTLGFAILLTLAGCIYGDRMPETRSVFITLTEPRVQQQTNSAAADGEFQDALNIIDTVLTSQGFVRDREPVGASGRGVVASYAKHQGNDRLLGGPAVYIQADRLRVEFGAEGGVNSRISRATANVINLLRDDLARRYGPARVTVDR